MSRFEKDYHTNENTGVIFEKINNFLISSGYVKETYNGEYVYKKGDGWLAAPKYIKVNNMGGNCIKVQAWMKWVLLPYVFIGEMDFTQNTFAGAIDKSKLKAIVEGIDTIVLQTNSNTTNTGWNFDGNSAQVTVESEDEKTVSWHDQWSSGNSSTQNNDIHSELNQNNAWGNSFSTNQQQIVDKSGVTKKEFVEKYAAENVRKDIRNAAITGYVCSGLTLVLGVAMANPIGIVLGLIIAGLVLGFHLAKSKVCAIAWLVLVSLDCIVSIATVGSPSGWIMIIAGVWAVKALNNADKEYKIFKEKM